ncbi:MAG: GxxExxY protein [Pseudomonadota bacterium]
MDRQDINPVNQRNSSQSRQRRDNMEYQEVTETIIGCAYRVYNKMGFGFLESVYEKCLLIELRKAGLNTESQKPITVYYESEIVGEFVADIIVNDAIILELKSVRRIIKAHEVQLVNYLVATGKPVGLILNFGEKKVEIKRKVKDLN